MSNGTIENTIIEKLKQGYPYYRSRENDATFDNYRIVSILKLDDKRLWRIYIERVDDPDNVYLARFVDLTYQDCIYLTKDEYDHKDLLDSEWPGGEMYVENVNYWKWHKKEFRKIALSAWLYRVKNKLELFLRDLNESISRHLQWRSKRERA